jgi:hypothetical protein
MVTNRPIDLAENEMSNVDAQEIKRSTLQDILPKLLPHLKIIIGS